MVEEITGGVLKRWTNKLAGSSLTYKYAALYKISLHNWTPTKNASVVTKEQAYLIYRIGKGLPFNLGEVICSNISRAVLKMDNSLLPHPCLIYALIMHHGVKDQGGDHISDVNKLVFEQTLTRTEGRVKDLPYSAADDDTKDTTVPSQHHGSTSSTLDEQMACRELGYIVNELQATAAKLIKIRNVFLSAPIQGEKEDEEIEEDEDEDDEEEGF